LEETLGGQAGPFASHNGARRNGARGRTNGLRLAGALRITGTTARFHSPSTRRAGKWTSVVAAQMPKACRQALVTSEHRDHSPPVRIPQENIGELGSESRLGKPTKCLSSGANQSLRQVSNCWFPGPKIGT
jgi:hypothetical protein